MDRVGRGPAYSEPVDAVRIDADQLDLAATAWDAAVDKTPDVDEFCASSIWSFSAAQSFPDVDPPVLVGDGESFAGMRRTTTDEGTTILVGLDPIWGFATPVVGHPMRAAQFLAARLRLEEHDLAVVTGRREHDVVIACLARVLGDDRRLFQGPTEQRLQADLRDGVDAWFARRSSRFRQQLRRIDRRATEAGVEVLDLSALPPESVMERVLTVEEQSWKGAKGTGLASEPLADFYRRITWRLAASDQLRFLVATAGGSDLGYVLGGVRGRTYRGLQLSYHRNASHLGVGHLLQWHQLRALEATGIDTYDLGMDMEYKRRWADRIDETFAVVIAP